MQADMEKEGLRVGSNTAAIKAKLESQQQLEMLKLGVKGEEIKSRQEADGMRMGIDVAKARAQMQQTQKPQGAAE
jgi:hypothetical protein